ncbi:MAG: amidohydrolase family protein [Novosphingobium sp.]
MTKAYDLKIINGEILDGSGGAPVRGDVAMRDGVIAALGDCPGEAAEVIDASGLMVAPGFVDIHTHYDGQATWEHQLKPSSQHGVTTVVIGNCGVGFAPCRPEERAMLVKVMEGVEDIPEIVITRGLPWQWQTFPEYLDFLAGRRFDTDIAAYVPHAALRVFVMGERGARREPSTAADRERMTELVVEAMAAGAIGVSTSRSLSHLDSDGNQAPHVCTDREELLALARGLRQAGRGMFQLAGGFTGQQLEDVFPGSAGSAIEDVLAHEVGLYVDICRESGRPLTFSLAQVNDEPSMIDRALELVERANREPGIVIRPQVFPRPIGLLFGLDLSLNPFSFHPSYKEVEHLPLAERVERMRSPELRARIVAEGQCEQLGASMQRFLSKRALAGYPFAGTIDYEPDPATSLAAIARREGCAVEQAAYDALLAADGKGLIFLPINNFSGETLDSIHGMLVSDQTLIGLGDGGAHYGFICDASYPTFLLSYWTRDRVKGNGRRISLGDAVHRLTRRNALALGLTDRGLIAPGMKADLNILDYQALRLGPPEAAYDLPAGGRRLSQRAEGIVATVVGGEITYRDGKATQALPGRLLLGGVAGLRANPDISVGEDHE